MYIMYNYGYQNSELSENDLFNPNITFCIS